MAACVLVLLAEQQRSRCAEDMARPVRVGVHIRAGDAENDPNRLLPHAFFFSVIRAITKVMLQDHFVFWPIQHLLNCRQPA